jgi:signal transduction histidine kinase
LNNDKPRETFPAQRVNLWTDEFLTSLSHELHAPLNAILGWSQLLRYGNVGPEQFTESVEVIQRNARLQVRLIEQLLDMSRILCGALRLEMQNVELESMIHAAVLSVCPAAKEKRIRIEKTFDPLAPPVRGDPARLQQIFTTLISNAMEFTTTGGIVQVILKRVGPHVEISMTDDGQGIPANVLEHISDHLNRTGFSSRAVDARLDMGLILAKNLIEMHEGSIAVESGSEGKGTTFRVTLPTANP